MDVTFVEFIQVTTQIITAGTAVIIAVLSYKTYLKPLEQESESEVEKAPENEPEQIKEAIVFKTSNQTTKLIITTNGLECHLIDAREGRGGHQWTITPTETRNILTRANFHINPGFKVNTGTFTIGKRRNWLYSKRLYPEPEYLHGVIKQLLENINP